MKTIKIRLHEFLGWRYSDTTDLDELLGTIIPQLETYGRVTINLRNVVEEVGFIPSTYIENPEVIHKKYRNEEDSSGYFEIDPQDLIKKGFRFSWNLLKKS